MFTVYWMKCNRAFAKKFDSEQMSQALKFCEKLRVVQNCNGKVSFISLCSELPNNTTKMGVDEPSLEYCWKKRRK